MFGKFWSRLSSRDAPPLSPPSGYRAYTTDFDREIHGRDLRSWLGSAGEQAFYAYVEGYENRMGPRRGAAHIVARSSVQKLKATVSPSSMADTVAALLVDHSGSLRGERAMLATVLSEIVADYWKLLGIPYELLGFTTSSWKGGQSRAAWEHAGRPANPGRLCDLLHVVYRSADATNPDVPWSIRYLMRLELLKENVDGEALAWAARRLRERPEARKILLVVSDGTPVDDSTILANDPEILVRHLQQTIAEIQAAPDFRLAAIGIDHHVSEYYSDSIEIGAADDLAKHVIPFLEDLFKDPASSPMPS
jgi:cobaltochelatase CobT